MTIKHKFVSSIADDPAAAAAGEVVPSNWNDDHTGNLPVSQLNGGTGASASTFWRGDETWAALPSNAPAYPVTITGGVSGGIPYFNSTTQESASALLSANGIVVGGGAGAAPATIAGFTMNAVTGEGIKIPGGTTTTDLQAETITHTVNASGVVFTNGIMNITKTAAANGSGFYSYKISGTEAIRLGYPGTNSTLGTITFPGIKLVSGADTMTLSADNNFTSTIGVNNALILAYGGNGNGVGLVAGGVPDSNRTNGSPNGIYLGRYGISIGRHGVTNSSVSGNAGVVFQPHQADDVVGGLLLTGQSAYAQATVNTAGGNAQVLGGIGQRFFTVVDWTQLGGKTITVVINGTSTTKTEGVNWTAATSNAATATSIAAAFNAVAGLDSNITVAVGAVAYFQPAATTWTYQLDLSTNATAPGGTVTSGNDGVVRLGPPTTVARLPTPSTALMSARSFVTDANATMTAGIGAVVAAGGSNAVPVYCDGTNWRIG